MKIAFHVYGTPAPQGSKRHVGNGVMVESSKRVRPWRADVVEAALRYLDNEPIPAPIDKPVRLTIGFVFARPKSHYRTGRYSRFTKPSAPYYVTSRAVGDLDKLVRSTQDAIVTAGLLTDDSLVVELHAFKAYGGNNIPGASIEIQEIA